MHRVRAQDDGSERRRRHRLIAALLLAVIVVIVGVQLVRDGEDRYVLLPVVAPKETGDRMGLPRLSDWPTRGDRFHDEELLRAARAAWMPGAEDIHLSLEGSLPNQWWPDDLERVAVLFAGHVGNETVVLMTTDRLLARYDAPGRLIVWPVPGLVRMPDALVLTESKPRPHAQVRFLMRPSVSRLEVSPVSGERPAWRPVTIRDGVSDSVDLDHLDGNCQDSVLLRTPNPFDAADPPQTLLHYWLAPYPAKISFVPADGRNSDDSTMDAPEALRQVRGLLCDPLTDFNLRSEPLSSVSWREIWRGALPEDAGPASLVYQRLAYAGIQIVGDGTISDGVLVGSGTGPAGAADDQPPPVWSMVYG
ncbi:MAG: hypothetical protein ACRDJH_22845, partial [Thermomicrobiales bacterium]